MLKKSKKWVKLSKRFPFISVRKTKKASLVLVEELWQACYSDAEKYLYTELRAKMYYPTPHYWISNIKANIALVPFKLALIEKKKGLDEKRISRALKKQGWSVLFYQADDLTKNEVEYVDRVLEHASIQGHISTPS